MDRNKAYRKFVKAWGEGAQLVMVLEETAELQKEVCKTIRGRVNAIELIDEMADVRVMLEQLQFIYGITDEHLEGIMDQKVIRTLKKLDNKQ